MKKILPIIIFSISISAEIDWSNENECTLPDNTNFVNNIIKNMSYFELIKHHTTSSPSQTIKSLSKHNTLINMTREQINKNMSNEFYDFTISVRLENKDEYAYTTKGFIFDE